MAPVWEVVASAVEVRLERPRGSALAPGKLSRGATLEQLRLAGEELHFRRLTGTGPAEGWIAICKGCRCGSSRCPPFAENARRAGGEEPPQEFALGEDLVIEPGKFSEQVTRRAAAAPPPQAPAVAAAPLYEPPAGGAHPAAERCRRELERQCAAWQFVGIPELQENHMKELPGMRYGMEFPHTPVLLQSGRYGAQWLTKAFHAAGTLDPENAVTRLFNMKPISGGGACLKACFEVEYAKPARGLHTKLFMKHPFDFDSKAQRSDRMNSSIMLQPADLAEVDAYRLLEASLPFPMPKFYFGDISNASTNFILITEFIPFGDRKKRLQDFRPFEVEPAYDKFLDDQQFSDTYEYYELMTKANATMAGWYKAGKLGERDRLSQFFFDQTQAIPESGLPEAEFRSKLKAGEEFIRNIKHFFPPGTITEASLKEWRRVLNIVNAYKPEILRLAASNEDYVAMAHGNLNVDNTWWWRDGGGRLQVGVLDWGGLGKVCLPVKLWWSYYSCELHLLEDHLEALLDTFLETYRKEGGPQLKGEVVRRDFMFAALDQCIGLLGAIPAVYRVIPKKCWEAGEVEDRHDQRLRESFLTRMYVMGLVLVTRMIFRFNLGQLCDELLKTPGLRPRRLPEV